MDFFLPPPLPSIYLFHYYRAASAMIKTCILNTKFNSQMVNSQETYHIFLNPCMCVLVTQSCLTLCNPMNCSRQAPLSIGFSRQEYWSGLPFPSPGDLPNQGIEHRSPALQADPFLTELERSHYCRYESILAVS